MKTILFNANIITMSEKDEIITKTLEAKNKSSIINYTTKNNNAINNKKIEKVKYQQALCYENGIIQKVGTNEEILKLKDKDTKVINMKGKTILPSFIDSHSHFSAVANSFLQVDLNECKSFDEIKNKILEYKSKNNIADNEWIIASGYDNNILKEQKHPDIKFLDTVKINNPIVLKHKSEHMGVFNKKALEILNINEYTPSPEGGKIEIKNGKVTGYLEETAFVNYLKQIPMPNINKLLKAYEKAQNEYLSYGITTLQEGYMSKELLSIYHKLIRQHRLKLDVVGYPDYDSIKEYAHTFPNSYKKYDNHFKIQGIKMILDGSPQGRTAWMKEPYEFKEQNIVKNKKWCELKKRQQAEKLYSTENEELYEKKDYKGYPAMKHNDIVRNIKFAKENGLQILAHCNGDAAAEEYIKALEECEENKLSYQEQKNKQNTQYANKESRFKNNNLHYIKKLRPVIIHAQLIAKEDLLKAQKVGAIPSFFVAHIYYWGDVHLKNFGIKRVSRISPVKEAVDNNMIFTLHQDSPIIKPNMLETIWCAVKRQTKSGKILGKDERISVYNALKGITINSAYSYFEETEKGSIEKGKKAQFVVLNKNPLEIPIDEIPNIKIIKTIY